MKLPGFPVARRGAGETLASVVARFLDRSAAQKTRILSRLGLYVSTPSSVLPGDLRQLASMMPPGHPWEDAPEVIVKGHTLVPLLLHFAHPERAAATLNAIIIDNNVRPTTTLGIPSTMSGIQQHVGKFCPDCLANDLNTLGYSAFYRQHQPPFVKMCAVHARPLHSNCSCCQNSRKAIGRWQMAGRCGCSEPLTSPILETDLGAKSQETWLWLSRQVAIILAAPDPLPKVHVGANLLTALRSGGFASKKSGGLDPNALTEALLDRFSEPFLKQLGVGRWCETPRLWPSDMLSRSVIDGRRIPSVQRMLLLARMVTDDIRSLWNLVAPEPTSERDRLPMGYSRNTNNNRKRLDKEAIESALDAARGKITVAAKRLGVRVSALGADLRHHHIHLPLPAITSKRLGAKRIAAVRDALEQGVPKHKIQERFHVSGWSIVLVELDGPELSDAHREATVVRQREKHRNALLKFLRESPGESRRTFAKRFAGVYDWLRKYDWDWLNSNLPESRAGRGGGKRGAHKDWHQLDQAASMAVRQTTRQELTKSDRPIRLTLSRLLSAAGASAAIAHEGRDRYPSAVAEAKRLAETKPQFARRAIRWALQKLAEQHLAISVLRLVPLASVSRKDFKEHRDYIIKVAAELEMTFDSRSLLAPLSDDPDDCTTLTSRTT
jgi:hypothetical protein